MILNISNRVSSNLPCFTLNSLVEISEGKVSSFDFLIVSSFVRCAEMRFRILRNYEIYQHIIKKSTNKSELNTEWNRIMLDIDWDNVSPMSYPSVVDESLSHIYKYDLNNVESLILLCYNLGIKLDYINLSTDKVEVSETQPYCTKRMIKYFPHMLVKIPRSEYIELRKTNKWLAIKSGNYFYKNKLNLK